MRVNKTFIGAEPTWANACVGNNGYVSYIHYAEGFSAAANLLAKQVLLCRGIENPVDTFVYPICFNMRHSVELRLKGNIDRLQKMAKSRLSITEIDLNKTHDIILLWNHVKLLSRDFDKRSTDSINSLDEYISDIGEIDATGQTFRYPHDTDNTKHLTKESIINVAVLYQRFTELEKQLKYFERFTEQLEEEYRVGTYTRTLSRADIFSIAKQLPPRPEWRTSAFQEAKESIKLQYGIGSSEFSKAINIIQENHETAQIINQPLKLAAIDLASLDIFYKCWARYHAESLDKINSNPDTCIDYFDQSNLEDRQKHWEMLRASTLELSEALDEHKLADLYALHYFGQELKYSEYYTKILESQLISVKANSTRNGSLIEDVRNILEKTSSGESILKSLYFLGQLSHAEEIVKNFPFTKEWQWIESARTRSRSFAPLLLQQNA